MSLQSTLRQRAGSTLTDIALEIADHFYRLGANLPLEPPRDEAMVALLGAIEERHRARLEARGWNDAPANADELPGWLLRLERNER